MRLFVYLCIVFFVLAGCSLKKPTLSEVLKYEQNTAILTDAPTLLHEESENLKNDFLEKYFSVWDKDYLWISQEDAFFGFELLKNKSKYAVENLIEADDDWTKNIKKLSNFDNYGSNLSYAITTQNTNLRLLPTDKPFFRASSKSFDYPFDRIQNSFISVMQPLMVSHYSTDFAWAFIESGAAAGWVKSNELAIVDKQIIQKIKNASKIVVTKDNAAVYYKEGLFAHYLKAGSILPVHEYKNGLYEAFIINTQKDGNGFIANITVSEEFAAPFPLEFNDENVKTALNELLGENYGWGGLYANRDCSAMTKDFFSLFGIWLPRNSRAQKNAGIYFDISNLTASQKEQKIKELAQPYLTLIFMPGHIMLYTGQMDERALIMHNIWAVTNSKGKKFLIGKSVISDLHIGENLPDVKDRNLLISKIQGFSVLAPKEAKDAIKLLNTYQESISSIKNNLIYFKNGKTLIFDDGKNKTLEEMLQNADVQDQLY
ncbi:MAG: SH3 domain-containing protein, partial [Campylobacteraceae bacterium]|nr:SH3 domain-containing protein [Campylobacteraceae bacterium]